MDEDVKLSRKLKKIYIYMDFGFWLQSHSAIIKNKKNWDSGAKPKLAKLLWSNFANFGFTLQTQFLINFFSL